MTKPIAPDKAAVWKVEVVKQVDLEERLNKASQSGRIMSLFMTELRDGSMQVVFEIFPYQKKDK